MNKNRNADFIKWLCYKYNLAFGSKLVATLDMVETAYLEGKEQGRAENEKTPIL